MDIVKSLDRTVISAIHDLNIAAMYCDRLYAVKGGEIVGCGRPRRFSPRTLSGVYTRWRPRFFPMRADSFTSCTTQLTGFKQYLLSNGPELQKSTWPTPASGSGHVLLLFRLEEHT